MSTKMLRLLAAILAFGLLAAACGGDDDESAAGGDCEAGQTDGDLNLYNWAEYIDPELKTQFEEEFGVSAAAPVAVAAAPAAGGARASSVRCVT